MQRSQLPPINRPQSNPDAGIYFVHSYQLEAVQNSLAKLARRAIKLGCTPPDVAYGASQTYVIGHDREKHSDNWFAIFADYVQVTVSGTAPKFDGWRLVARLLHASQTGLAETIINAVPGENVPVIYRTSGCVCDHCKVNNKVRKDTFVVANDAGEFKQVGSKCIRDFLGHQSPSNIVARYTLFSDGIAACFNPDAMDDEGNEPYGLFVRGATLIGLDRLLATVAAHHRVYGWTSKAAADDHHPASINTVTMVLFARMVTEDDFKLAASLIPTDADEARASQAIAWAQGINGASDFEHNMKLIATAGTASNRTVGIAAAIIGAFKKATEADAIAKAPKVESQYVGVVGQKLEIAITVQSVRCISETQYGPLWLHRMIDAAGNALVWFTGAESLSEGETGIIKATVKKHDLYNGKKQTVLTRVKATNKVPA